MTTVEAVYQGGVFKPTAPVDLPDNQRVRLRVEPLSAAAVEARAWLEEARRFREQIAARVGTLPDCAPEIAEDRRRDV